MLESSFPEELAGDGLPVVALKGVSGPRATSGAWYGERHCQPWNRLCKESKEAPSNPSPSLTTMSSSCLPFTNVTASPMPSGGESTAGQKNTLASRLGRCIGEQSLVFDSLVSVTAKLPCVGLSRAGRVAEASNDLLVKSEWNVGPMEATGTNPGGSLSQEASRS